MKTIILSIALLFAAMPALADGPGPSRVDPPVEVPVFAPPSWNGAYARLTFGQRVTESVISLTETEEACFRVKGNKGEPCFYTETVTVDAGTEKVESDDVFGMASLGYGHTFGPVVLRGEAGIGKDTKAIHGHAGLDIGRALPYLAAGKSFQDNDWQTSFGAGVDFSLGERAIVGVYLNRVEAEEPTQDITFSIAFRL